MNYSTAGDAFENIFKKIIQNGSDRPDGTRAIYNKSFTVLDVTKYKSFPEWRNFNLEYAELEWKWYKSGDRNPEMVVKKAKLWKQMVDEHGLVNSNYGAWWMRNNQLDFAIELLRKDKGSRRSIVVHYSPDEIHSYGKDTPCNLVMNFFVEQDTLYLTVFARSIDLVYGFCNDQFIFSRLMIEVAQHLDLELGAFHYFITNLHVYDKHIEMRNKYYTKNK